MPVKKSTIIAILITLAAVIGVLGVFYYMGEKEHIFKEKGNELKTIAELKANQLDSYHIDRLAYVQVLAGNELLRDVVKLWLADTSNTTLKDRIVRKLRLPIDNFGYHRILITSAEGKIFLNIGEVNEKIHPVSLSRIRLSAQTGKIQVTDFYRDPAQDRISYDITAPLVTEQGIPFAVIMIQIDTKAFIYPLLVWWPAEQKSSETCLGTAGEDSLLFIGELRKHKNKSFEHSIAMKDTEVLLVKAALGGRGFYEGIDNNGTPVFGYITAVQGTSWFLVAKTDKDELYSELYKDVLLFIVIGGLSFFFIAAFSLFLYSRRQRNIYRDLWQTEQEFKTTLYSIGDAVITTNKKGIVKYLNPVAEQLTGWTEGEALGKPVEEVFKLISEDTRQAVENPVQKVLNEGVIIGLANHTLLIARNGNEIPISDSGAPINTAKGELVGVVLVFRDQIAERAAQKVLEESEKRYSQVLNLVNDAVWEWDVKLRDGFATSNFYTMLGYQNNAFTSFEDLMEMVHPEDKERAVPEIFKSIADGNGFDAYLRMEKKTGGYIWFDLRGRVAKTDENGKVTKMAGTLSNITERKEAEARVLLLNERLERAEQNASLGSWEFYPDTKSGYWSPQMFRLFDIEVRDIPPTNEEYYNLIHPEDRTIVQQAMEALMAGTLPVVSPFRTNPENCKPRFLFPTWRVVTKEQGEIVKFEGTLQDISELKIAEENYKKLFNQMIDGFALHEIIVDEEGVPFDYRFIAVNPSFEKLTGLNAQQIIGKTVLEVLPQTEKFWITKYGSVALTGKPEYFENFSGSLNKYFEVSAFQPFKNHFATIFVDVTHRKRAENIKKLQLSLANAVISSLTIEEFIKQIQTVLSEYIDTTNILYGEYNKENSEFTARYYNDEQDTYTTWKLEDTISGYVFKQGKLCVFNKEELLKLEAEGVIKLKGVIPQQWIGIPLSVGADKLGILIVRSYTNPEMVKPAHTEILEMVAKELSIYIEHKHSEEVLRENEKQFRQMFENHTAIKLLIDSETGAIYNANHAAALFYGWKIDELKQMNIDQLHTLPHSLVNKRIEQILRGEHNRFEAKHRLKTGEERDVEVMSSRIEFHAKVFVHSIVHDITKRKKAEMMNKLLSKSIEQSPISVVITDQMGEIVYVNNRFVQVTGYTHEEIIGENPRILSSGTQTIGFYEEMWSQILSGKTWQGEIQNKKKNGDLFWEDVIISPLVNHDGDITHFVAVKEDISEKKKMIYELVVAKEKAEEMNKVKSSFFANMSHELRTPLIGILGFSEILEEELESNSELKQMAETINKGGNRLLETLNLILGISKLESNKQEVNFKSFDIIPSLQDIYNLFKKAAQTKGLNYSLQITSPSIVCKLDVTLFYNIINNLINNAVKFTDSGEVKLYAGINETDAVIEVQDTGIGISADQKHIIFEEFRQASEGLSRSYEGTGLGLSIAKKYTELMDGKITMESELNKGTIFRIVFPLAQLD